MKLSDYVIDFISRQGASHIFEFIGGAITHLLDSTVDRDDVHCISVHHEQSGAFAAEVSSLASSFAARFAIHSACFSSSHAPISSRPKREPLNISGTGWGPRFVDDG